MGFSRQEYWSGLPFPSQGIIPTQESNLGLLHCRQILYRLSRQGSPGGPPSLSDPRGAVLRLCDQEGLLDFENEK